MSIHQHLSLVACNRCNLTLRKMGNPELVSYAKMSTEFYLIDCSWDESEEVIEEPIFPLEWRCPNCGDALTIPAQIALDKIANIGPRYSDVQGVKSDE